MQEENIFKLRAVIALIKHISDAPDSVPDTDLGLMFIVRELEEILEEEENRQNEYDMQIEELKLSMQETIDELKNKE